MRGLIKRYLRRQALEHGRHVRLWRRFGQPSREDWAEYLRRHGGFAGFGEGCWISTDTVFTNPYLTRLGDNVRIAGAWISCHDGSINMINRAYGLNLDAVGPVEFGDDVFIGIGAKILPNTRIGSRSIVAAGAVVSGEFPDGSVIAGVPARRVRSIEEHVERLKARNATYPWYDLVQTRTAENYWSLEPELQRRRAAHFFGAKKTRNTPPPQS